MKRIVYALGFFDGVHLGHQALLRECCRMASELDAVPAAITFDRHPMSLFTPATPPLINANTDRDALLRHFGIRHIHRLSVCKEVMSTPWEDFILALMADGQAGFVCGDDFTFGHKVEGNARKLQEFCAKRGIPCVIVPEQAIDGVRVSSTHIRRMIEQGDVETAAAFLGHPHFFTGEVVPGRQLGRTLGIPTANLRLPPQVVCPKFGVYACVAHAGGKTYPAVTNVGTRPTVGGAHITVEPWILGFEGDLYGAQLGLEFHKFLRPEVKFPSLEALQVQIRQDAQETLRILANI